MLRKFYNNYIGTHNVSALLRREIDASWSILDIGSGRNPSVAALSKKGWCVGIDHYLPYIKTEKNKDVHDANILGDVRALPFKDNSFDCAVATEIIEHLRKEDGFIMLSEMERVSRQKIILTTPNGFLPTLPGPDDNPDEAHISGWEVEELRSLGFEIYGFNGPKGLWKLKEGRSTLKAIPEEMPIVSAVITDIANSLVYNNPEKAFQLFFVKVLDKCKN